jgi:hypothetical protein
VNKRVKVEVSHRLGVALLKVAKSKKDFYVITNSFMSDTGVVETVEAEVLESPS